MQLLQAEMASYSVVYFPLFLHGLHPFTPTKPGRVVSMSDSQSGFFLVVPSTNPWPPLSMSNWVPVGILNHAMSYFELFVSKYL